MKKRIAILLGLILVLSAAFAACSQPAATAKAVRIDGNETHTFKISIADFADAGSTPFNVYTKKINQKNEDGTTTETTLTARKDEVIMSGEVNLMNNSDQIRPLDASGTYTVNIDDTTNATTVTVTTEQILYCQYETAKLQELNCLETVKKYNVTAKDENPFENNDGRTTLRSEIKTSVTYAKDENQLPAKSVSENKGYYIGKTAQKESEYKFESTYDFENKKVTVKGYINGKDIDEERALKGNCIDANQFLMFVRSYDKSSAAFQDNPTISVYDVTTDSTFVAAFAINRKFNLLYDNNGNEAIVAVDSVVSTVGGIPFIAQYNLPDLTADNKDCINVGIEKRCKYTTIKFRSGWFSYELQPDQNMQQLINGIKLDVIAE